MLSSGAPCRLIRRGADMTDKDLKRQIEAVRRVGSDRMVFGIDGPHPYPTPVGYAVGEINRIRSLPISDGDKHNLFWGTIARLLRLE